ncbi:MAG: hypothetical protein LQ337_001717 [Flavoplaca oasis]|nr:MAG: hypothetical protein LQ337_001717 [Flavoplaca oasis]
MAPNCPAFDCPNPGRIPCPKCKSVSYCSTNCQKSNLPSHEQSCVAAASKHNCYLVRASPNTSTPTTTSVSDQIEPLHLEHYGNEAAEVKELRTRLQWSSVHEAAKFYDHAGTDSWYYYVYGHSDGGPKNEAVSRASHTGKDIHGDVAIIRSGPAGYDTPETFTKTELANALEFYGTRSGRKIFNEREKNRFMAKMGMRF